MNSWSHIFVCLDSFQCSCMHTVARSSISAHGSGWALSFFWTLCLKTFHFGRALSFFWTLCLKTFHFGTVCVCLASSSPLPRYCCCVDCLHCDLDTLYFIVFFIGKLETGDSQNLKYGVYRIIGSGATVQSVSRCLLVVKMVIPLFHDGMRKLQRWNHLTSE